MIEIVFQADGYIGTHTWEYQHVEPALSAIDHRDADITITSVIVDETVVYNRRDDTYADIEEFLETYR